MIAYVLRRLLDLVFVLLGVSILVFLMVRFIPGDAVEIMLGANTDITPDRVAALRHSLGLDLPVHAQYWKWLTGVLHGDLGTSIWTGRPVSEEILARLPATLEITLLALLLALILSFPLGVLAARAHGSVSDVVVRVLSIVGLTLPTFWVGVLMLLAFSLYLPGWPAIGYVPIEQQPLGNLARMALPTVAVSLPIIAGLTRILRSSLLEVLGSDYVRTARSKGLGERIVLYKHALRNALIPVVTIVGLQFGQLIGFSIVTESIFQWPGAGNLLLKSIYESDFPVVATYIILIALIVVVLNVLVDVTYAFIDPRIRYA